MKQQTTDAPAAACNDSEATRTPSMDEQARKHVRKGCAACRCEILRINGELPEQGSVIEGIIENISRGGFRFLSGHSLELEDRLDVLIHFTDGRVHRSRGRVCYCEEGDGGVPAYGFSVLRGFYSL